MTCVRRIFIFRLFHSPIHIFCYRVLWLKWRTCTFGYTFSLAFFFIDGGSYTRFCDVYQTSPHSLFPFLPTQTGIKEWYDSIGGLGSFNNILVLTFFQVRLQGLLFRSLTPYSCDDSANNTIASRNNPKHERISVHKSRVRRQHYKSVRSEHSPSGSATRDFTSVCPIDPVRYLVRVETRSTQYCSYGTGRFVAEGYAALSPSSSSTSSTSSSSPIRFILFDSGKEKLIGSRTEAEIQKALIGSRKFGNEADTTKSRKKLKHYRYYGHWCLFTNHTVTQL